MYLCLCFLVDESRNGTWRVLVMWAREGLGNRRRSEQGTSATKDLVQSSASNTTHRRGERSSTPKRIARWCKVVLLCVGAVPGARERILVLPVDDLSNPPCAVSSSRFYGKLCSRGHYRLRFGQPSMVCSMFIIAFVLSVIWAP